MSNSITMAALAARMKGESSFPTSGDIAHDEFEAKCLEIYNLQISLKKLEDDLDKRRF